MLDKPAMLVTLDNTQLTRLGIFNAADLESPIGNIARHGDDSFA